MPFALRTNTPAVFQALVNDVLRDLPNIYDFVYLDDILIFSKSEQNHVQHVRSIFQKLLDKAEKFEFSVSKVSFLGFIINGSNIQMDPTRVKAVINWPIPF